MEASAVLRSPSDLVPIGFETRPRTFVRHDAVAPMIEFYPQIKLAHVIAVFLSGGLFAVRGLARLFERRWAMAAPVRYLSDCADA